MLWNLTGKMDKYRSNKYFEGFRVSQGSRSGVVDSHAIRAMMEDRDSVEARLREFEAQEAYAKDPRFVMVNGQYVLASVD